jgi:hypothetical protein
LFAALVATYGIYLVRQYNIRKKCILCLWKIMTYLTFNKLIPSVLFNK